MLRFSSMLQLTDDADAALAALEADRSRADLLSRVDAVLDGIEADPSDARWRHRRFAVPPVWCVTVVAGTDEYMVLWRFNANDEPVVVYIGPQPAQ